ncbi:MAG: 2Fe-2S iron-sulfur cluster binding domain-containing protein [Bacteroidia bacterium]|nr:2Fe-2S iron-sulfur cluster binding domain-containing protein [Bacteroidia bacterium]
MAAFNKLRVTDIRQETKDCVSVAVEVPAGLKDQYRYIQGQYLTLKLNVNGEEIRRSYSICSSPVADSELRIAVKRVKGGKVSNYLNDHLKKGDELEVMTPMGSFYTPLDPANKKKYFLFAGGSGITPMFSILRSVLFAEPNSSVILFYGNTDEVHTIFRHALNEIEEKSGGRLKIHYLYEHPKEACDALHTGMLTREKAAELFERFCGVGFNHEYFVCGPGPMMENVKSVIMDQKVPAHQFHIEYFSSAQESAAKEMNPSLTAQVTVSMYGIETHFELDSNGKSILDAALDAGVDVPFACKGAVCCTCRGKLLEGKVKMDKNFALTDAEVAQGFILTCQSHPLTPVVRIDYDS